MPRVRLGRPLLCLAVLTLGCGRSAPIPSDASVNETDLAACLPPHVRMSTPLPDQNGLTVAQRLRELGAYAKNGKLYDRTGKEIYFWQGIKGGPQSTPEMAKQQAEEERKLRESYTVLDLRIPGV